MRTLSEKRPKSDARGCLRRYRGGSQSLVRLVCFPWAGGGASVYRRFASHLPETIELLAVQYPGREDRFSEHRLRHMDLLVQHVLDSLIAMCDRPLVFFGHSMGALVAYEVAQALKARLAHEPRMLIVSGSGSPDTEGTYTRCAAGASEEELIADIHRLGGTPREILEDKQLVRTLLPVLRADYEVLDTYVSSAAAPLTCTLIACAGDNDPSATRASVETWRQYTLGPCRHHWFNGDHFYLCSQPLVFAQRLREWIEPRDTRYENTRENINGIR